MQGPHGPSNLSIDQHGNLSVNLFVLKKISFTFPFSFSPSFPPFSFFSLFFSPNFFFLSFIQKHLPGAGPPLGAGPGAAAPRADRLIRYSTVYMLFFTQVLDAALDSLFDQIEVETVDPFHDNENGEFNVAKTFLE